MLKRISKQLINPIPRLNCVTARFCSKPAKAYLSHRDYLLTIQKIMNFTSIESRKNKVNTEKGTYTQNYIALPYHDVYTDIGEYFLHEEAPISIIQICPHFYQEKRGKLSPEEISKLTFPEYTSSFSRNYFLEPSLILDSEAVKYQIKKNEGVRNPSDDIEFFNSVNEAIESTLRIPESFSGNNMQCSLCIEIFKKTQIYLSDLSEQLTRIEVFKTHTYEELIEFKEYVIDMVLEVYGNITVINMFSRFLDIPPKIHHLNRIISDLEPLGQNMNIIVDPFLFFLSTNAIGEFEKVEISNHKTEISKIALYDFLCGSNHNEYSLEDDLIQLGFPKPSETTVLENFKLYLKIYNEHMKGFKKRLAKKRNDYYSDSDGEK